MMFKFYILDVEDPSEDGHPCEVAMLFRSEALRTGIIKEIPADVMDLHICFGWIGKAISRTEKLSEWIVNKIDPNTADIIPALSLDHDLRLRALKHAVYAQPFSGREGDLRALRDSCGFKSALRVLECLVSERCPEVELHRLSSSAEICKKIGFVSKKNMKINENKIVSIEAYRRANS